MHCYVISQNLLFATIYLPKQPSSEEHRLLRFLAPGASTSWSACSGGAAPLRWRREAPAGDPAAAWGRRPPGRNLEAAAADRAACVRSRCLTPYGCGGSYRVCPYSLPVMSDERSDWTIDQRRTGQKCDFISQWNSNPPGRRWCHRSGPGAVTRRGCSRGAHRRDHSSQPVRVLEIADRPLGSALRCSRACLYAALRAVLHRRSPLR